MNRVNKLGRGIMSGRQWRMLMPLGYLTAYLDRSTVQEIVFLSQMTDTDNMICSAVKCTNWCTNLKTLNCFRFVVFYYFLIECYISFICNEQVPFVLTPHRLFLLLKEELIAISAAGAGSWIAEKTVTQKGRSRSYCDEIKLNSHKLNSTVEKWTDLNFIVQCGGQRLKVS